MCRKEHQEVIAIWFKAILSMIYGGVVDILATRAIYRMMFQMKCGRIISIIGSSKDVCLENGGA